MLCRLSIKPVVVQTASKSQKETSGGADSRKTVCGGVLELGEGLIGLETLRNVLRTLCTEAVVAHPASKSQKEMSGGADGRKRGVWQHT